MLLRLLALLKFTSVKKSASVLGELDGICVILEQLAKLTETQKDDTIIRRIRMALSTILGVNTVVSAIKDK